MEEVHNLSKRKLEKLVSTLMEECEMVNSKNCMLKNTCSRLKKELKDWKERSKNLGI